MELERDVDGGIDEGGLATCGCIGKVGWGCVGTYWTTTSAVNVFGDFRDKNSTTTKSNKEYGLTT